MGPVYCAHCIINMEYDPRVPKPYYVNNKGDVVRPGNFSELIDAIASYGNRFEFQGIKYAGYASTIVNGTALCQSHALIEIMKNWNN